MLKRTLNTLLTLVIAAAAFAADDYWVFPMKQVHAKYSGQAGSVRLLGDSITMDENFWDGAAYVSAAPDFDLQAVKAYIDPGSWLVKGQGFGNMKGWTLKNGMGSLDVFILKRQNPETCVIMFGTNDLEGGSPQDTGYDANMRLVIDRILKHGTVAIISTIPPKRNKLKLVAEYNNEIRKIAAEKQVPLIELYGEIIKRQPEKWDGTLISDGTHLTWDSRKCDFSDESLAGNGNAVRNYVTFKKYSEVYEKVFKR